MNYKLEYVNSYGGRVKFSFYDGIVVTDIFGLSENFIEIAGSQGFNQVGQTVHNRAVLAKDIVVNGEITEDAANKKKKLLDTVLPGITGKLVFNNEYYLDVEPRMTPSVERYSDTARFQFTLFAHYPYWRRTYYEAATIAGDMPLFKFPFNMQKPYWLSTRVEGMTSRVYNGGNVETGFRVVFTADSAVRNPGIRKTGGGYIKINRDMKAGESVTVDTTSGRLLVYSELGGEKDYNIGFLDIGSELFALTPGDNILRFEADSNPEGLAIAVYYNETFAGVC